jgi:ABC-type transporter Mla subunit MlaD
MPKSSKPKKPKAPTIKKTLEEMAFNLHQLNIAKKNWWDAALTDQEIRAYHTDAHTIMAASAGHFDAAMKQLGEFKTLLIEQDLRLGNIEEVLDMVHSTNEKKDEQLDRIVACLNTITNRIVRLENSENTLLQQTAKAVLDLQQRVSAIENAPAVMR